MTAAVRGVRSFLWAALFITVVFFISVTLKYKSSGGAEIRRQIEETFKTSYPPQEFKAQNAKIQTITTTITTTSVSATTITTTKVLSSASSTHASAASTVAGQPIDSSKSPNSFDVVINWYKDDKDELLKELKEIRSLPILSKYSEIRVFIYVKDEDVDLEELKTTFETRLVFPHENRGRESSAFLHHIIENWDNLGAHTFFRQAHMHHYREAITRITDYLVTPSSTNSTQTGLLSLGWFERCRCGHCHDPWDGSRIYSRLPEMYSMIHGQLCPGDITLTYIGQFVVSRRRVHQNPVRIYQDLKDIIMSDMDHWIHEDESKGLDDSSNAPAFGHTMERSWTVLFRCESPRLAEECGVTINSLLTARKKGDSITKCQCLDT